MKAKKAINAPAPASANESVEICTSSGSPPERSENAGVGPSAEITAAASGGPASTARLAISVASTPCCTSSRAVVAPRLRRVAISAVCRSTSIVETTSGSSRRRHLFATLDPEDRFAIVEFEQLRSIAGTVGSNAQAVANELWVDFEDDLPLDEQEALVALLSEEGASPLQILAPVHQAARLDEVEADPTLKASGSGILLLAFRGAMGAAVLGFVVTLVMTVRARVVELAVLRALGSSRLEILRAMLLEWGVVLLLGTATGVLLGRQIARLTLQFLEVTEDGERVVPGFVLATGWGLLGVGLAVLTGVAVLVLWSSWRIVLRRANAAALRLTQ